MKHHHLIGRQAARSLVTATENGVNPEEAEMQESGWKACSCGHLLSPRVQLCLTLIRLIKISIRELLRVLETPLER